MQTNLRISRIFVAAIAALTAIGAFAAIALAAPEQTRESYVAEVEPICKTNVEANERLLSNAHKEVKQGKLKLAGRQFAEAASAGRKAVKQIKAAAVPPADATKLKQWVGYLESEQKLLGEISKALKAEKKSRVSTLSVQLTNNGNRANATVVVFEFHYCKIETSKFS